MPRFSQFGIIALVNFSTEYFCVCEAVKASWQPHYMYHHHTVLLLGKIKHWDSVVTIKILECNTNVTAKSQQSNINLLNNPYGIH